MKRFWLLMPNVTIVDHLRDFVWGAGSVVDPFPQGDRRSYAFQQNDRQALIADWTAVGNDIYNGIGGMEEARPLDKPSPKKHRSVKTSRVAASNI